MENKKLDLISKLCIFGIIYFTGVFTAMYFCYKQPVDEHVAIYNRYLNWPEKNCYTEQDIKMIIEGPNNKIDE